MEKVSVIIRVKNEKENLEKLLLILKNQTYQDFKIIIVNDNSTDGSDAVALDYFPKDRVKVVNVPKDKFTYPYASNLGAKNAKGKYLVYLSAHSYPLSDTWLEVGIKDFNSDKVAGVFAYPLANPDVNLITRLTFGLHAKYRLKYSQYKVYSQRRSNLLGTTNAILRADLWKKRSFNEKFYFGGEDAEWASYWVAKGYVIIQDPKFRVYHSHNLDPIGIIKQHLAWKRMRNFKPEQ